ncbi:DUF2911 domain-containing protein [Dyadobacter sandarakinus]|uniref:DUF2911 domain-containing protein n=1 Tax=Dyadobacter sandarakinus TaxID=2747268 RepID=A0ABX7I9A6_9BACT|nr:DUF2911 domain-containing protein [Dyadobacter sandarakinus]QRR01758.1 DUF2911 domain-containing protein [Dyadobacter sandarakinus]
MKKYILAIILSVYLLTTVSAQRIPAASPSATVSQTIGITDFTVHYSRPFLKGRKVFADSAALAPYNQLWRTGANMPTTFEASTPFMFGDRKVPAGKYALYSIPSGAAWTVILNKNYQTGADTYSADNDVARIMAVPSSSDFHEAFTISIDPITDSTAALNLAWSSVNVTVPLAVETGLLTMTALNKAVAENPEDVAVLQSAAGFLLSKGKDLQIALGMADKAIGLKETYMNLWLKAQILNKLGKTAEALPVAQKALTLGPAANDQAFGFYKGQIEKGIADMQAKIPAGKAVAAKTKKKKNNR